ncbi:MAG: Trehalose/maltose import ATP-binding protein MalK [Methanoregulaceae archaeon PtaB.Bin056]|nr:MAG: Trehalose/maltose import ATP-binding protein MalK [Methanoregulaceae archaeon PtaB.Bin056]
MTAIVIDNLTKRFDDLVAVDNVSFSVKSGELFGLLGPNGAGKTTILNMLTTLLVPTAGSALIAGSDIKKDPDGVRSNIGIIFQDPSLDIGLTGRENLEFHAMMYNIERSERKKRIAEVLKVVNLSEKADTLVEYYSGGMKRRLEIARGLIHYPRVLFLDEPTLGLDAQTRRSIWDYIKNLNKEYGTSIILTTHYMEEADYLCDRIAIIDRGKIIALDTPANLKVQYKRDRITLAVPDIPESLVTELEKRAWVQDILSENGNLVLSVSKGEENLPELFHLLHSLGVSVSAVSLHTPTLEDVFIHLTGASIREQDGSRRSAIRDRMRRRMMR